MTNNYIAHIGAVAKEYGVNADMAQVGVRLSAIWEKLETVAQTLNYDIFKEHKSLEKAMSDMLAMLYAVPYAEHTEDTAQIITKDSEYGASWCRRGGTGAFFMLCRKWDRIETALKKNGDLEQTLKKDQRAEGILDDLGDLRRYLILVFAWRRAAEDPQESMGF